MMKLYDGRLCERNNRILDVDVYFFDSRPFWLDFRL